MLEDVMNREAVLDRLRGCYLALPTLFGEGFALNLGGMRRHVEFMIENGLREGNATFLVSGATGEFPVLSIDERKRTAETVVDAAAGRVGVIVGAQSLSTLQAADIARHAQQIGADALQVSAPFYFPPTDDDVLEHVATIAAAAPDLGIVFYPTWWLGYSTSLEMIARLADIAQVVALKWSAPGVLEYQLGLKRFRDRLGMIDNMLLPILSKMMGAIGTNLHPAMFWPEWGVRLWAALESADWDAAQADVDLLLLPFYDIIRDIGRVTGGEGHIDKLALDLVGLPGGITRPPTRPLPQVFRDRLRRLCLQAGVPLNRV
jgi:4-hydroxy-tetrahydrodipicolinate synthase